MKLVVGVFQNAGLSIVSLLVILMRGHVSVSVLEQYARGLLCWIHPAVSVSVHAKLLTVAMVIASVIVNAAALGYR